MYRTILKWTPAHPMRKPDNIISSTSKPVFKPSYLQEATENITYLLSNEYMKMWFREKALYDKNTYIREEIIRGECKIKRRNIQRMATYRRPSKNHFIDDYVERKIGLNKTNNASNQELSFKKMKFKPSCPKKTEDRKERQVIKINSKSNTRRQETSKANATKDNDGSDESDNGCEIEMCPLNCEQSRVV